MKKYPVYRSLTPLLTYWMFLCTRWEKSSKYLILAMYFPNIQCALPITNPAIYFPNIDVFLRQAWQTPAMNASTSRQCTMEWRHRRRSARRSFFFYLFDVWKRRVKAQTCALKHKHLSFFLQGSEEGSFGDCRKQERMAAKFGNKCKQSCPGLHHCHRHCA